MLWGMGSIGNIPFSLLNDRVKLNARGFLYCSKMFLFYHKSDNYDASDLNSKNLSIGPRVYFRDHKIFSNKGFFSFFSFWLIDVYVHCTCNVSR